MNEITITQSGVFVTLHWQIPPSNGGEIDYFTIQILNRTGNEYQTQPIMCPGTDVTILNCTIQMSEFISELGYSGGQAIKAIATAHNQIGFGTPSNPNSQTVIIQTAPTQSVTFNDPIITLTSVYLSWSQLTISQYGYSPVT
jgi:hypothetical protein